MWTEFYDLASGGREKEKWPFIFIEAPETEAVDIFEKRFGHSPFSVTCSCCGEDYAIYELAELPPDAHRRNALFISADQIRALKLGENNEN